MTARIAFDLEPHILALGANPRSSTARAALMAVFDTGSNADRRLAGEALDAANELLDDAPPTLLTGADAGLCALTVADAVRLNALVRVLRTAFPAARDVRYADDRHVTITLNARDGSAPELRAKLEAFGTVTRYQFCEFGGAAWHKFTVEAWEGEE